MHFSKLIPCRDTCKSVFRPLSNIALKIKFNTIYTYEPNIGGTQVSYMKFHQNLPVLETSYIRLGT